MIIRMNGKQLAGPQSVALKMEDLREMVLRDQELQKYQQLQDFAAIAAAIAFLTFIASAMKPAAEVVFGVAEDVIDLFIGF